MIKPLYKYLEASEKPHSAMNKRNRNKMVSKQRTMKQRKAETGEGPGFPVSDP